MKQKNQHMRGLLGATALTCILSIQQIQAQELKNSVSVGKNVYELAVDEGAGAVYVAATGERDTPGAGPKIYKFDAATLNKVDSISLESGPIFGLTINTKTHTLYGSNTVGNAVTAIDLKTWKQTTIPSGKESSHPRELIVDEKNNVVYVSDVVGREDPGRIWIIDGKENKVLKVLETGGKITTGVALDNKRNRLYFTNYGGDEIGILDLSNDKVLRTFPSGGKQPTNLVYDVAQDRLFVTNQETANVTVVAPESGEILATIATGKGALGIAYNAKTQQAFVANRMEGNVSVIDTKTYKLVKQLETGSHPNTVVIAPKSGKAYVSNKAKMPAKGETPVTDPNGDTLSVIE